MNRRSFLAVPCVLATCLAVAGEGPVVFANGRLEIVLPPTFKVLENNTDGLVAVFGPKEDHRLEFSLTDMGDTAAPADVAEQFVRNQATRKALRAKELPGKVVMMDPGAVFRQDGVDYRRVHWQIGFGRQLVVMTLTAPAQMTPALDEFLGQPLNTAVGSLQPHA